MTIFNISMLFCLPFTICTGRVSLGFFVRGGGGQISILKNNWDAAPFFFHSAFGLACIPEKLSDNKIEIRIKKRNIKETTLEIREDFSDNKIFN